MKYLLLVLSFAVIFPVYAASYGYTGNDIINRATGGYRLNNNLRTQGRVRTYSNGKNVLYDQNDAASRIYKAGKNGSINVYDNSGNKVGTIRNLPANQGFTFDSAGNKTGSFRTYSGGQTVLYDNSGNRRGSLRSY